MDPKVCVIFVLCEGFFCLFVLFLIQLEQWLEMKGGKETSKLMRFSHR